MQFEHVQLIFMGQETPETSFLYKVLVNDN